MSEKKIDDGCKQFVPVRVSNPLKTSNCRNFKFVRVEDETGLSGEGVVAEGIEFSNGMCAISWLTGMHSIGVYPNVKQMEAIHGHNGRTKVVFETQEAPK